MWRFLTRLCLKKNNDLKHLLVQLPASWSPEQQAKVQLRSWEAQLEPAVYVNSLWPDDKWVTWENKNLCPWKSLFKWEVFKSQSQGVLADFPYSKPVHRYNATALPARGAGLWKVAVMKSQGTLPSGGNLKSLLKYSHGLPCIWESICLQPTFKTKAPWYFKSNTTWTLF